VSSSKKLSIAAAILAVGFCLALLFAAPRATYVAPDTAGRLQPSKVENLSRPLAGPTGIDAARLVPEFKPEGQPEPEEQPPLAVAMPRVPELAVPVAEKPTLPSPLQARLVGVGSRPPDSATDVRPHTQAVSLPQVSVQVSTLKPVYATVEYPEVVSPVPAATVAQQPRANLLQTSFDPHAGEADRAPADGLTRRSGEEPTTSLRTHVIVDGDSLPRLAARYLDDPQRGKEIFQLNQGTLTDPELLPIGLELKIPPRPLPAGSSVAGAEDRVPVGAAPESGLVPVDEFPVSGTAPRAKLLRPMPAAYPGPQP